MLRYRTYVRVVGVASVGTASERIATVGPSAEAGASARPPTSPEPPGSSETLDAKHAATIPSGGGKFLSRQIESVEHSGPDLRPLFVQVREVGITLLNPQEAGLLAAAYRRHTGGVVPEQEHLYVLPAVPGVMLVRVARVDIFGPSPLNSVVYDVRAWGMHEQLLGEWSYYDLTRSAPPARP
jgi:hypothetical protein